MEKEDESHTVLRDTPWHWETRMILDMLVMKVWVLLLVLGLASMLMMVMMEEEEFSPESCWLTAASLSESSPCR